MVPGDMIAEILDGDLWATPRPAPRHSHAAAMLTAELGPPFGQGRGGPGGWWLLFEPEIHREDDVLVPDLAGWRRERLDKELERAFITLSPDWVCEILSPSTERIDRETKLRIYAREGVSHVWLVDPVARTLEAMRLVNGRWAALPTLRDDDLAQVEPFDTVPFPLTRIWIQR